MDNQILVEALTAYLHTAELTPEKRKRVVAELTRLDETQKDFWSSFLNQNEDLAYHYSEVLDAQGTGFYESLPQF